MKRKWVVWVLVVVVIAAGAGVGVWFYLNREAKTAGEQLTWARQMEQDNNVRIAELKATGDPGDLRRAEELQGKTLSEYAKVGARFPGTPEVEEADFAGLKIRDAASTAPETRLSLIKEFLDKHTSTTRAADLRWQAAGIIRNDVKKPLDAIKAFEEFAKDFPKDSRAAEALFRCGQIYEEIKEFARAVDFYKRVSKDYPNSPFADKAQFQVGTLLADKMEKKAEAAKEFEKMAKEHPQSPMAGAAAGQAKRLAGEAGASEQQQKKDKYYKGVREVTTIERLADEMDSAQMKQIRAQATDLVHEDIDAELVPEDGTLSATVKMQIARAGEPENGPARESVTMQLSQAVKVSSVLRDGAAAKFSKQGKYVVVDLGEKAFARGTTQTFELTYGGTIPPGGMGEQVTSRSTLLIGPGWVPLLDFGDNFTADIAVTVPRGQTAVTQGTPMGDEVLPGREGAGRKMRISAEAAAGEGASDEGGGEGTTKSGSFARGLGGLVDRAVDIAAGRVKYRFRQEQPVYIYTVAAGTYRATNGEHDSKVSAASRGAAATPLTVLLFADTTETLGARYVDELKSILDFYESRLGAFPYPKQIVAQTGSFPGGFGSPGLILVGPPGFMQGDAPAAFLAHEVGHAWFGNLLTLNLGPGSIPWLSEGFAQYWDACYHEQKEGKAAFQRLLRDRAESYWAALARVQDRPLNDARWHDPIYAPLTYEKGAFVLHALRGVMGDERFFAMMRQYVDANRQRVVTIDDFRRAAEKEYGAPLDWFFEEWINKPGIPRYRINRALQMKDGAGVGVGEGAAGARGGFVTQLEVEQVGPNPPIKMPVEFEVEQKGAAAYREKFTISDAITTVTLVTPKEPVKVTLDPDYWILKHPRHEENEKMVTVDGAGGAAGGATSAHDADKQTSTSIP